jgi:O-antigen/teichoic acid export membrane protein
VFRRLVDVAEESARGGFFLFAGNASSTLVLAVGSIIIARLLGPEGYGVFSLSLVVPSILVGLIDLGVDQALIRYSARLRAEGRPQQVAGMLRTGFIFRLAVSLAAFLLSFFFSDQLAGLILRRPEMGFYVRLASLAILFQTLYSTLSSAFVGLDKMENGALVMNVRAVARTAMCPLLIVSSLGVAGAIIGHVASYALAGLVGGLLLLKIYVEYGEPSGNGFSNNLKVMLAYGFPLYFSTLLAYLLGQYQTLVLALFTTNVEIGNFIVATTLSAAAVSLLTFPLAALFPAFSKLDHSNEDLGKLFTLSIKYSALLVVPASTVLSILSKDFIYLVYGPNYELAPAFLSLYVLTFLYTGFGSAVLGHFFNGVGETRVVFKSNLINLMVFFPLAPMLTMLYRVPGLIAALLVSNVFPLLYGLFVARRRFHARVDVKASTKIYMASLVSAIPTLAFLHIFTYGNIIRIIAGGLVFLLTYLTILPVIRGVTTSDLENFKLTLSKNRTIWSLLRYLIAYENTICRRLS